MKLFNSVGPNPHVVRMFMKEKGIELPLVEVDIVAGENRQEEYIATNPGAQCPALQLDDGTVFSEITVLCEYLEEKHPEPALIGSTPEERAETRMWTRRIDLGICEKLANGFRFAEGLKMFENRMVCRPEAADGLKAIAQDRIGWLNSQMGDNEFICGDRFTLADVLLFGFLNFGNQVGQPIDEKNEWVASWFERVKARPSAEA